MGFLMVAGKPVSERQPGGRTLPEAVDRIIRACGLKAPGTVTAPSEHVLKAVAAVNDAVERVVTETKWDWRVVWASFQIEDNIFGYDLPADYSLYAAGPMNSNPVRTKPLSFIPYATLVRGYPNLATVTSGELGDLDVQSLVVVTGNILGNTDLVGQPQYWTIYGGKLMLFPIPSETYYTDNNLSFADDQNWLFAYHTTFRELKEDTDILPVPAYLLSVVHWLALAFFKQALEYPDFQVDEARGERQLRSLVTKNRAIYNSRYKAYESVEVDGV